MVVVENELFPLEYKDVKIGKYKIYKYGNIWSKYKRGYLKQLKDKNGYLIVCLSVNKKVRYTARVATLVANAFLGSPPQDMKDPTVNHKDSIKTNNYYKNLEWMERGKNSSIRNNKGAGILNHEAILSDIQVKEICHLIITTSLTFEQIGELFGVTKHTIHNIAQKKNWKEITQSYGDLKQYRKTYRNELQQIKSYNPFLQKEECV